MGTGADLNIAPSGTHSHGSVSPGDFYMFFDAQGGGSIDAAVGNDVVAASTNTGQATHAHTAGDFAGSIGLVTGGVNGNAAMTVGNPPFLALNFEIKY